METELITSDGTSLDLTSDIPISLNFAIADIRDPSKRNGAFSKTIKLYGTKTNNDFFEHIYEVNIATSNFNPNVKTAVIVYQNSINVFEGYLRLMQIDQKMANERQEISYEVLLFGDNNDLFATIGELKLQDLDLSTYNHVYNRVNQEATWLSTLGSGYVYPLIDYGYNNFLTNSFKVEWFRPAFYVKTYVDKIFSDAGKTYTSSFFNSTEFKRLIIPHNGDKFTMSSSNLAQYEFLAGDTGASVANTKALTSVGGSGFWWSGQLFNSAAAAYQMANNDDTTNPFIDSGNRYDTSTGIFTVGNTGTYNLNWVTDFEIKFSSVPAGTVSIALNPTYNYWCVRYCVFLSTDGGVSYNPVPVYDNFKLPTSVISTTYQTVSQTWTIPSMSLNTGDKLKFIVHPLYSASGVGIDFLDGSSLPITSGTAQMDWRYVSSATLSSKLATGDYVSGQTLSINDAIPKDIKQKDFLVSLFRMLNLYVDIDPDDVNNYLIETRDDFYSSGDTIDWTNKLATDQTFTIKPMAEVDAKNFIYRYKEDQDYYNVQYQDANSEAYGTYKKIITNDFTKKDNISEVIFSPTPVVDNPNNSMIIPKIFAYDGTTVKPQKHNIRILRYNGKRTIASGTWNYVAPTSDALGAATLAQSSYPEAGMVDDPLNPTVSIEFGVPNEVFYTLGTYYTTNNLYNRYYSKFLTEITDRDSKICTGYFWLTPSDISQFDFRNKLFIKDCYYFVNKIMDYSPIKDRLTKVELIKIKDADAYTPTQVAVSAIETNTNNTGLTARMFGASSTETNTGKGNNVLIGENNNARSVGSFVSGNRNSVGDGSLRVNIISSDSCNVSENCTGINLIGCSGINVGAGCFNISLMNCYGMNIADFVYGYVGINKNNVNITTADNNTSDYGG